MSTKTLLSNTSTIAAGTAVAPEYVANPKGLLQVKMETGTSAYNFTLQGSIDGGTTYAIMGTYTEADVSKLTEVNLAPLMRANLVSITGGNITVKLSDI